MHSGVRGQIGGGARPAGHIEPDVPTIEASNPDSAALLAALPRSRAVVTTREIAARAGTSVAAAFRGLALLESDGLVSRRLGASVAAVGWVAAPAARMGA